MNHLLPCDIFSGCWDGGHCQGIALDPQHECIYYSFTTMLIKTDLQGRLIGSVTGLLGHLGCIDFCDRDGRLYGSLEYKNDQIGKGILSSLGSAAELENGFYIAVFDAGKITRPGMDACRDGVMTTVFLSQVLEDYTSGRRGCSGIDGLTFGPIPGDPGGKEHLFVAYGIYGDVTRSDNDDQVLLCYDTENWRALEKPLMQSAMHRSGPAAPDRTFLVHTGNTTYGVQNLEYDAASGHYLMAVYPGKKEQYPNYPLYIIDGSKPPSADGDGERLTLLGNGTDEPTPGWRFPHGSTGLYSLGDGRFYVSEHGRCAEGHCTHAHLYRWNGTDPLERLS